MTLHEAPTDSLNQSGRMSLLMLSCFIRLHRLKSIREPPKIFGCIFAIKANATPHFILIGFFSHDMIYLLMSIPNLDKISQLKQTFEDLWNKEKLE